MRPEFSKKNALWEVKMAQVISELATLKLKLLLDRWNLNREMFLNSKAVLSTNICLSYILHEITCKAPM